MKAQFVNQEEVSTPATHEHTRGPSKAQVFLALRSQEDANCWADEWTTESKGRFMIVSHAIRVKLAESSPCVGHVHAVRMSYEDLSMHVGGTSQIPDEYHLRFQPLGSGGRAWKISQVEFNMVRQMCKWVNE